MSMNLFSTVDPLGRIVHLTDQCHQFHIMVAHPDMADESEIERGIRLAEYITQDAIDPNRLVYYRSYQRTPQRRMIKVVVDAGEVVTAYRVKRIKQGELILWRR